MDCPEIDDANKAVVYDEHLRVYTGEVAKAIIAEKKSRSNLDPKNGAIRVSLSRWQEAQRYEKRSWLEQGKRRADDRNQLHRTRFGEYTAIKGENFRRGIELGCGPFTNMRLILERLNVDNVHLLDPLINEYQLHPLCRYKRARLGGLLSLLRPTLLLFALAHPRILFADAINRFKIGGVCGRKVALHACAIEDYQEETRFDLVVLINVLEHCRDAEVVFRKVDAILEGGGILVFADKLYRAAEVVKLSETQYDAGHPLSVDKELIDTWLEKYSALLRAEYSERTHERATGWKEVVYFIGRKPQE